MTGLHAKAYRAAFTDYLRYGTPIDLSIKQERPTTRYVWRTQRDSRVRPTHRRNEGRIFSWTDPPATGHPGEGYNCRCEAIPYVAGSTEFAFHDVTTRLASAYDRWNNIDFVNHYYFGGGRPVTLLEIGHLREIVEQYAYADRTEGAFARLSDQIADAAREEGPGAFSHPFRNFYNFKPVAFSHGSARVKGLFVGKAVDRGAMLAISGESNFYFTDDFTDPLDIDIEPGGTPYPITGTWKARFTAEVFKDKRVSHFYDRAKPP